MNVFQTIVHTFRQGDFRTKASFAVMGFGQLVRGQAMSGLAFLGAEVLYIWWMALYGCWYLARLTTLGTVETLRINRQTIYGDNSFQILLFGLVTLLATMAFIVLWYRNILENAREEDLLKKNLPLPNSRDQFRALTDRKLSGTLLFLPTLGIFLFTVVPILFMICVAFTNYDAQHQPPAKLFSWVGLENFGALFQSGGAGYAATFRSVLLWTIVWAILATFLNYYLGIFVALLIGKKGIRFKPFWRTIFVMTIAVPQFVSLLYVSQLFTSDGLVNGALKKAGLIAKSIPFWSDPSLARLMVVLINIWIGVPYMMVIATGILENIPKSLYESAAMDGANAWQRFRYITMPFMRFVTGPFLLTQFIGNLNNFNVIYLLTGGGPFSASRAQNAGYTDLLVTWLYKMTVNNANYRMASVIGVIVFILTAVVTLSVYRILPSVREENIYS
ncbi:MAG: sugar ABC transporter permease [Eubacterium sp.]|nr:sugar ABC transporter permease [Eubacterium sp.]